jgi:hypothetical protein
VAGELASLLPQGGIAAGVVTLFAWYARTSAADRKEFREAYRQAKAGFDADLAAAKADFQARLAEEHARVLETEMNAEHESKQLRARLAETDVAVARERQGRLTAEVDNEGLRVRLEHARTRIKLLKGEEVDLD